MKKTYLEPKFEIVKIRLTSDILTASQEETLPDPSVHTEPLTFPSEEPF